MTIQRLVDREKTDQPRYAQWSMACYYERAIRFQPDDHIVRLLYATYLIKKNRLEEARSQLEKAISLDVENAFTHFNVGLVYTDMKDYDRALAQAHIAMQLGLPRTELKDRLVAAGKWVEPPGPELAKKP